MKRIILLLAVFVTAFANFVQAQCITPVSPTICAGAVQQLTANPAGVPLTFSNNNVTTIPSSGNFNPYPSSISVTGIPTTGLQVASVQLNGVSHTFASDLDLVLVAPNGTTVILMSDAAGANDFINANLVFRDGFPTIPSVNPIPSGTYGCTNTAGGDNFPAPGPGTVNNVNPVLSAFTGNFNGTWSLYGVDQFAGDFGQITSWSITFAPAITINWTGPAGTIFTNAAATTPYVAGSNASQVFVKPTATSVYTATFSGGVCAGANNVTVNVNPLPVVAVSPTTSCGSPSNVLTASGANTYTWTPAAGLNATTGATVTANPTTTTTYTVTGTNTATGCTNTATALVNSAPTAAVLTSASAATFQINEGFDAAPAGWLITNNSNPVGTTSWFLSTNAVFPAFDGAPTAAVGANFNNGAGVADISTWLFTPTINIKNGDNISFYTRAATGGGIFPDRLEVRLSTNGASTNVGSTTTSVGDFTTLILTVNPSLTSTGYPENWTQYTATVSGITGTVSGRLAFRYFVPNGGPAGANSNFIGLDRVQYSTPAAATCINTVSNLIVTVTGGVGPYNLVYSDGTNNITYNNYPSGGTINVTPNVTTTYSLVSVTGANGCVGSGLSGTATITITPPVAITTQPAATTNVCVGNNATISVGVNTINGTTYQWQINTVPAPGTPVWTNVTNGGIYSGATTATLTITGAPITSTGNSFRVLVTGACGGNLTSTASTLSVNNPATIATQPPTSFVGCQFGSVTIAALGAGNALTYQWQVSTNGGVSFTNLANGANYANVTTSALTINNIPLSFVNNQYRVLVTSGGCTAVASNASTLSVVNTAPVVVISIAPTNTIQPGTTATLTAAVSSATAPIAYQWFRNGVAIPGATANTYVADVNGLGTYTVRVNDANLCNAVSSTPVDILLSASASNTLYIYPSPNNGSFQVRYYNANASATINEATQLNVYDSKGSRVFTQRYTIVGPYTQMRVNLGVHNAGIYRVELTNNRGERIKTGSVIVF
ncbi:choice-of-anchor J domain-containing protein [Ferruginibacter yonginensis]|uniref:Choice-of-anchor J domain-containing protein n=1 Tax=Ferruginibacter yonginensis TaxID=1310416 RepID=A0ABV8QTQ0_9BACT